MQLILIIPTAYMNPYDSMPTKNMSLKRNKNAFHLSTAAVSTSQKTIDRNKTPIYVQPQLPHKIQNTRNSDLNQQPQVRQRQQMPKIIHPKDSIQKLSDTDHYKSLKYLINEQNQTNKNKESCKYFYNQGNSHSYIYKGLSSFQQSHQNYEYCKNKQQNFPPHYVNEIYQKQLKKSPDSRVNYHSGYLQRTGYFYFSIQNTLILCSSKIYENSSDQSVQQPIILENHELSHILCIKQIVIEDLDVQDIQRHPFGQKNIVLLLWQPWKINFYAFQPYSLIKLENLNMRFSVSCQGAFLIDYCHKGNIYYLNQNGELGRITLFDKQTTLMNLFNWNWNKKFRIKQYFFKFSHQTARKYQKFNEYHQRCPSLTSPIILKQIKQFYLDKKYYWSAKKTKGISLLCDRQRNLLYTLVQTSLKNSKDTNRHTNQSNRQIRMYNIDQKSTSRNNVNFFSRMFDRFQTQIYSNPPSLLRQLNQQQLYYEIGSRCLNNTTLTKFQISGLYIPSQYIARQESFLQTNLVIILSNSTRLFVVLSSQRLTLNQMINMPNVDQITTHVTQIASRNKATKTKFLTSQQQNIIISQKQQINFRLLNFLYNKQERSLAVFGLYKKSILGILFTQNISFSQMDSKQYQKKTQNILDRIYYSHQEQIVIVWDSQQEDINSKSIFVNASDFKIFISPELENNIYKRKITSHRQKIKSPSQVYGQGGCRSQLKQISRQVLHYPRQYLFMNKDKIIGITKLRPVDVLLTCLHKEVSCRDHNYISTISLNDNQVQELYLKMHRRLRSRYLGLPFHQIICMLTQIFCDVDGIYYCQQFAVNSWNRKFNKEKMDRQHQREKLRNNQKERITVGTLTYNETNSSVLQNNQRPRFTQRVYIANKLKKFRHSDLMSGQGVGQIRIISNTPINVRSQNCLMKVIQRVVIFMVKNEARIKKQAGQIRAEGYSSQNSFQNKQIIQSILLYLSRVLNPIWQSQINSIKSSIFNFIADITKKIYQIYVKLSQQKFEIFNLPQVIHFIAILLQYNTMLAFIQVPVNLSYADGLGTQKNVFQEVIFNSLQRMKDNVSTQTSVSQWRSKFPNYFSLNLFKALKIQGEISLIGNRKMKKQAVINNCKHMPYYLLYYYCKDGTLSRRQINKLLQTQGSSKQGTKLKSVNDLMLADTLDPNQKVEYAIKEIMKRTRKLDEKQFLVFYALQNIRSIRTLSAIQWEAKLKQLGKIQNIIKIQKQILQQIDKFPNETVQNSKKLLNYHLLKPKQLKGLVSELKNPFITLIYFSSLTDQSVETNHLQQILRNLMFDSKNRLLNSHRYRQKITALFTNYPNSINKLPLTPFLVVLNQLAINEIQLNDLTMVIHRNEAEAIKREFWVPLFLSEWNWSQPSILEYYMEECKESFKPLPFQTQRRFIYNWVSAYTLVKFVYQEGRRKFQVFNEILLNLQNNESMDGRILGNFVRENLGY